MNDFNKDELEKLFYVLKRHDFRYSELINKIKSMTDNYCTQHTWIGCHDGIMFCYPCKANKNDV